MQGTRLRSGGSLTFFDLPSVIGKIKAGINGAGARESAVDGVPGGVFTLRDRPTLSYQPRTGDDLGASMLKALKAHVILDMPPGNDTRPLLLPFIDSINGVRNSPSATSPSSRILEPNDDFRSMVDLSTSLQHRGAVLVKVAA